jgi:PAS domain S-box-containing protein
LKDPLKNVDLRLDFFPAIFDSVADLIFIKNKELRTIYCNSSFTAFLGKKPEEILGKTDLEIGWDEDLIEGNHKAEKRGLCPA